jgi:ubiquinone/menaquinone biosynthesis C-methylase UbiE
LLVWKCDKHVRTNQEYLGNKILAEKTSEKGYDAIISEYVYIDSSEVEKTIKLIPNVYDKIQGIGIDLGGGVGCISSTIAKNPNVEKIFCVELVEEVVKLCQPIVKKQILKDQYEKVVSVVGDYNFLELPDNSVDFAISWDAMHHSQDPVITLQECKRVLNKNGIFIIIDRVHNNSTSDQEIERILNITYDEEFLKKNYRRLDEKLTRKENGEHEYRFYEWKEFFQKTGFELISNVIIKTKTEENLKLKNDDNVKEIFTEYELGAFGNRKIAYVLSPLKE